MLFKGFKFFSENFKGSEDNPENIKGFPSEENKGCETVRRAKFSIARDNKGYEIFHCQR